MWELKIGDESWHYNLAFKSFSGDVWNSCRRPETKANFCPYVRHIGKALCLVFFFSWFCSTLPFHLYEVFTIGPHFMTDGAIDNTPLLWNLWYVLGGLANWAVFTIVSVIAIVFGLMWTGEFVNNIIPEQVKKRLRDKYRQDPDAPDSTWTLIKAWFKAHHDKVCPPLVIVSSK